MTSLKPVQLTLAFIPPPQLHISFIEGLSLPDKISIDKIIACPVYGKWGIPKVTIYCP